VLKNLALTPSPQNLPRDFHAWPVRLNGEPSTVDLLWTPSPARTGRLEWGPSCPNSRHRFLLPKLRSTDFGHTSPYPVL